ncbi:hypothetical protein RB195_025470 [Necator americanus]|uniref:Uncharacterized protein n=1 Tax=Necator americanus TaxID=51031 RepID=A0ABR1ESF6_NECAM
MSTGRYKSHWRISPLWMRQRVLLEFVIVEVLERVLAYTMTCGGQPMINYRVICACTQQCHQLQPYESKKKEEMKSRFALVAQSRVNKSVSQLENEQP